MKNFPFQKDGKTFWYSRAIVCVSAVFGRDKDSKVYVLANQRGTATDKEVGKWNLPVGFLDFNETCSECASREIFEETGVKVDSSKLKLYNINSNPDGETQDVSFRYYILLDGFIDNYPISTKNQEKNEVLTAKWIDLSTLNDYNWAWNHLDLIKMFGTKLFGKNIFASKYGQEKILYTFKCIDGVKVDVFGTAHEYGHTDYYDCATYSQKSEDSPQNNFIKAYKDVIERHPRIKPIKVDSLLKSLIEKANSK